MTGSPQLIRVGHSPDPDDAFMFYALAKRRIDTDGFQFEHELADIETLNRRALSGELEVSAVSLHAYAYLAESYVLCSCGASMGDGYGPVVVASRPCTVRQLPEMNIAIPGTLTTAYLALRLCLASSFSRVIVPFDEIPDAVARGSYKDQPIDAGLLIHDAQLTYGIQDLNLVVDLGQWWQDQTSMPLPLGVNVIRKNLGPETVAQVDRLLRASIRYGLEHREDCLTYAAEFGHDLDRERADKFIGMYVNDWTVNFGTRGREAVAELLRRGHAAEIIPQLIKPEFVEN